MIKGYLEEEDFYCDSEGIISGSGSGSAATAHKKIAGR
jgi:hypothetical protein